MKLEVDIHKIKCIDNFKIELPIDKGLYAITGQKQRELVYLYS